jgi:EamA domain-containing membrane protein RarD
LIDIKPAGRHPAAATIRRPMNPGITYALLAFVMWGLFPLYFRQIASVPALEVVLHRSVWSLVFVLALLAGLRRFGWLRQLAAQPRRLGLFAISALLLSCNWLLYVYAVQSGQVVEASLGYFINPLVNVVLGVLVLHERLRPAQWAAVALAAHSRAWHWRPCCWLRWSRRCWPGGLCAAMVRWPVATSPWTHGCSWAAH